MVQTKAPTKFSKTWFPFLFSKKCSICKKHFVRERMWRAITGPYCNGFGKERFICQHCASTAEEADAKYDQMIKDSKPPCPSYIMRKSKDNIWQDIIYPQ